MSDPLWDRWRWIDAIVWQGAATEDQAFEAWYEAHRHLVSDRKPEERRALAKLLYTNDPDIKAFHKTITGQRLHAIYAFNTRLVRFLKRPDRPLRRWVWFLNWSYRRYLVEIGYAKSTLETELERARRREELARLRDAAALAEITEWFESLPPDLSPETADTDVIEAEFSDVSGV